MDGIPGSAISDRTQGLRVRISGEAGQLAKLRNRVIKLAFDMRLKDKVAIITGAAAGIGEASSRLFAAEGATVVALDLDSAGLDRLVGEIRDQGLA